MGRKWNKLVSWGVFLLFGGFLFCSPYAWSSIPAYQAIKQQAEQGDAIAQNNLGGLYLDGRGVLQNHQEALKWFVKAADQGLAEAQRNVGLIYLEGLGVHQDHQEAFKWYLKSAEQGMVCAQHDLGTMYFNGDGVPRNFVTAYMWLNLAAANGNESAVKNREIISKKMTPEQIAEAQKLSREWKPKK